MRKYLLGSCLPLLMVALSACGGSDENEGPAPDPTEGDIGITDTPSPTESAAVAPETSVVSCEIENGLPVAEVKVTNTTGQAGAFSIEVQFTSGDTVLGTGLEFTQELQPGQNQTIRMGNMQGDADAVDSCEVIDAAAME
jgi:hypothetical protein